MNARNKSDLGGINARKPKTSMSQQQIPAIGVLFVPFTWGSVATVHVMQKKIEDW